MNCKGMDTPGLGAGMAMATEMKSAQAAESLEKSMMMLMMEGG